MKNNKLLISALVFFLIINTTYYWEGLLGLLTFPAYIIIAIFFIVLIISLFIQIINSVKEKFKSRDRLFTVLVLTIIIALSIYKPFGLIDFDKMAGKDIFIASREGAANCLTTLKLKDSGKFIETTVCFGIDKVMGKYDYRNDTVFFRDSRFADYYNYGIILTDDYNRQAIELYREKTDSDPNMLFVKVNELKKTTLIQNPNKSQYSHP